MSVRQVRGTARGGVVDAGVHIRAVADLLGHSSISVTGDVYAHTSDDTARAAVRSWLARWGCSPKRSPHVSGL